MTTPLTEPLILEPTFAERVWGAETLPAYYAQPQAGHPVGEAWLTDVSCRVRGSDATLGEVMGDFPLLIKMLFPREKLSVQVHPNDAEAQAIGQARGKTECWYVVSAEPGATVAVGFAEATTAEEMRAAIAEGTLESRLRHVPVKAGYMVYVPAGTVHAIGPGVVILETQQYSDITYRIFDYGRPRELHLEQGLAVAKHVPEAGLVTPQEMDGFTRLVESEYFVVDRVRDASDVQGEGMRIFVALGEGATLGEMALPPGQAVVWTPECGAARLAIPGGVEVIRIATSA